ncbi:DUF378 domain-containing protein [Sporosarcina highlanderae]|uniref:DUF378 domain-containing protein n=1 Tax=Sporosarcina highlanderae TaxID=3035916 RepID=A0ABT8JV91_9BACL|nr:DUF378 domain-containing protein [Sporosarcina highlanderae]MDN4609096.1 DUF378 domain-containing protein [Sporosarcina highlanderae]
MINVRKLALAITIIGALNWGVVGLFSFDVVAQFANGYGKPLARFFYVVVGVSGLTSLTILFDYLKERDENKAIVIEPEKV